MIREYIQWGLVILSFLGLALNLKIDIDVNRFKVECSFFSNYWNFSRKDEFIGLEKEYYIFLEEIYLEQELFYEVLATSYLEINLFYSKVLLCFTYGSKDLNKEHIKEIKEQDSGNKAKLIYRGKVLDLNEE